MLIVTNVSTFPARWTAADGTSGRTEIARNAADFLRFRDAEDAVFLVNCDSRIVLDLTLRQLIAFRSTPPLIALDLVFLQRPESLTGRLGVHAKRILLRNVDYFLHYFKDTAGLEAVYGIHRDRSGFVDFKANLFAARAATPSPEGEYALCFGRSMRDFDTFFDALERVEYPGAIVDPQLAVLREHGSSFSRSLDDLPRNLRVLPDDATEASQVAALRGAKIVVVPMRKGRLIAAGISTILNAMALGKCVIASAGPGVTDIFDGQLLSVPPGDAPALARALSAAWSDDDLRLRTARAGWEYALWCGSEQDFNRRVIDAVVKWTTATARVERDPNPTS
jgi:glycosyltransferase involved in cell wall biosynthesis